MAPAFYFQPLTYSAGGSFHNDTRQVPASELQPSLRCTLEFPGRNKQPRSPWTARYSSSWELTVPGITVARG